MSSDSGIIPEDWLVQMGMGVGMGAGMNVGMKVAMTTGVRVRRYAVMAGLVFLSASGAWGQSPRSEQVQPPISELARENFSRVAASAGELKAVLFQDAGLMVELKRWVAKEATNQGQIVRDADLTNDAIFERLEEDVQFRGVATQLVRRYGYLLPKLNPNSELGQERELLMQERTKWLAKNQEEELQQSRPRNLENASGCETQAEPDCNAREAASDAACHAAARMESEADCDASEGRSPADSGGNAQPSYEPGGRGPTRSAPSERGYANPRAPGGGGTAEHSQLMQTSAEPADFGFPSGDSARDQYLNDPVLPEVFAEPAAASSREAGPGARRPNRFPENTREAGDGQRPLMRASESSGPMELRSGKRQTRPAPEPAEMVRAANPYLDIPSLYDMYVQARPRPTEPRRFGAEVFENGTRDTQMIPMDLPAGPDYVVGPGDGLSIDLWGGVAQRLYQTVDREGRVSLPEVGPLLVSGKSLAEVQQNLQQILRTQFRDVSADVSLARLRTIRVYEVGDLGKPGAYDISSLSTPLNALFSAGGPTARGSLRIVKHYRGNELVQVVDVYDLLLHGVKNGIARLENGDTVLVPPIGPQVTVEGMVRRPAIYELRDEKNLAQVLELAGGLLPAAALRHIEVERLVAHQKQTMLSLDIDQTGEAGDAEQVAEKLASLEIQDGDRVRIYPIAPYNQDAVYLEGHVLRPGKYSYRAEMRVTDVISSYQELLPEPAGNYAEIIRLNAPDFRPSVASFDLGEALANPAAAPRLQPLDTIRIFSRFDFENPPAVSVWGEVRTPGTYATSGQIHLSDAVHLAGGLAPDAQTEDAQVFRYLPDGQFKILSVKLGPALAGDPAENILLRARDRVLVHRNAEAVEPATVNIQGEVAKPGRYPLTANMTAADLIRVGGGLTPSAETGTADLTRYEWTASSAQAISSAGPSRLSGQHESIAISAALAGDPGSNVALRNGDVLTVRQLPGWNDLGAAIRVRGEVKHPGTYGIRPGERLSSVLERAGGFAPDAYAYGAVLQRTQVREVEARAQDQMILRVKDSETALELLPDTDPKQKQAKEMALQQWHTSLEQLSANPPMGRLAIRISLNVNRWKGTSADIEVRAGDTLVVPKKPGYVMVSGQVFNPTAVSYRPGKSAKWYLGQSGGPTQMADKKAIFVIRADGSVMSAKQGMWSGDSLEAGLQPGDTVVVPERALGGGVQWQNVFLAAQTAASVATAIIIGAHY